MSTTPIDSWAVDLANVTAIYPFVGTEFILAIVGIALWIVWHIWQIGFENRAFKDEVDKYGSPENMRKVIDE